MSVNDDAFVKEKTVRALTERMIGAVNALEFDPSMVGEATNAAQTAQSSAATAVAAATIAGFNVQVGSVALPTSPLPGQTVSVVVDSGTALPAVRWDSGGAPIINATDLLICTFIWTGADWLGTYGLPFESATLPPDVTPPIAGTLTASALTESGFTLTVTGASDDTALHTQPYAFSTDGGTTWTAYQPSPAKVVSGLAPDTDYSCIHRAKDAAGNVTTGTPVTAHTAPAAPFTPSTLTNKVAWYAGESLGPAGSAVASWPDSFSVAGPASNVTPSQQPQVAVISGVKVARFDADRLRATVTPAANSPITIALLAAWTTSSSYRVLLAGGSSSTLGAEPAVITNGGVWNAYPGTGIGGRVSTVPATTAGTFQTVIVIIDGTQTRIRVDGVETVFSTPGTSTLTEYTIGATTAGTFAWAGDVAEIIVVGHALTPTETTNVETWLNTKRAALS